MGVLHAKRVYVLIQTLDGTTTQQTTRNTMNTTTTNITISTEVTETRVRAGNYGVTVTVTGNGHKTVVKARVMKCEDAVRSYWTWYKAEGTQDVAGVKWGRVFGKGQWSAGAGDSSKAAIVGAMTAEAQRVHAMKMFSF